MDESFRAQLQATLNMIPAYTWYATPSGGLIFVNERNADYGGLPSDHPLRHGTDTSPAWDSHIPFLHPEDHEETRRVWSECLRTGRPGEVSFRAVNAEGGYRWFLSRAEPLKANDGTILCWIGINIDIEERKRVEEACGAASMVWRKPRGSATSVVSEWRSIPCGYSGQRSQLGFTGTHPAQNRRLIGYCSAFILRM